MRKSLLQRALAGEVDGFIGENYRQRRVRLLDDDIMAEAEYRAFRSYYGWGETPAMIVDASETVH